MPTIADIRQQYPQYSDMSDSALADALHSKFYSDMPREQFNSKIGLSQPLSAATGAVGTGQVQPDMATDIAKSAGTGVTEGGLGLAGLPGDVGSLVSAGVSKLGSMAGVNPNTVDAVKSAAATGLSRNMFAAPFTGPTSQQLTDTVQKATGPFYQPQTTAGKYAKTVGEFAPAVVGGPESLASRVLTRAVVPGVASEAAGEATEGTALEPVARIAGALVGATGASKVAGALTKAAPEAVPAVDELKQAATGAYNSPEVSAVKIRPDAIQNFTQDVEKKLLQSKVDKFNAPQVSGIIDRLSNPRFGEAHTIADLDLARQSLADVPHTENRAAAIVRKAIDDYLGKIPQGDLLAGDASAANAKLLEARANYAAMKRSQDVTNAMGRAENQAGSTYSGHNVENATRQQLRPLLNQKTGVAKTRAFQDYTPEEVSALRKAVVGTRTGNVIRSAGKLLGGGGGAGMLASGLAGGLTAREAGADPYSAIAMGVLSSLAGRGLNAYGNKLALNRAHQLDELLRSRAPLSAPIVARNAQLNTGILGNLPPKEAAMLQGLLAFKFGPQVDQRR